MERNEAMEIVRKLYNDSLFIKKDKEAMVTLIPELKESEVKEEKIRKWLIRTLKSLNNTAVQIDGAYEMMLPAIAWLEKQGNNDMGISEATKKKLEGNLNKALEKETPESCNEFLEKQGEQKLVEKVEPKFHEGEWITNGDYTWKIVEVKSLDYVLQSQDGNIVDDTISHVDEQFHSFTIEDTKDGDQCEQKPFGQRKECEDCQFNYAGECKGYCALKRNEQKPADKVESKFKVGDWIVDGLDSVYQIKEIKENKYFLQFYNSHNVISTKISTIDNDCHLWTIQDAKDGDILVYYNGCVVITLLFKKWYDGVGKGAYSYAHITNGGRHIHINDWSDCGLSAHPATKEQRDLLFKKMKEDGYEWDAEKKELKKIEQKPADEVKPKFKAGDWVVFDNGNVEHIISVGTHGYTFDDSDYLLHDECDKIAHLWTIQDAKDGDVLMINDKIVIFDSYETGSATVYCDYNGKFNPCHKAIFERFIVHPATKEQRDLLFAKMKETGYEWDAEKKELRKIEQKPADKVKPKFKIGDWIVSNGHLICGNSLMRIVKVGLTDYLCQYCNGQTTYCREFIDKSYHLWTIQDAKDGDVLVDSCAYYKNPLIFILKKFEHKDIGLAEPSDYSSYCFLTMSNNNKQDFKEGFYHHMHNIHPTIKEQRDLLFQKMHEAGYEWDSLNKELKKIENNPAEWSEEDKKSIHLACEFIRQHSSLIDSIGGIDCTVLIERLKSITPQKRWKPSKEQMDAIKDAIDYLGGNTKIVRKYLMSLYEDLKELRVE